MNTLMFRGELMSKCYLRALQVFYGVIVTRDPVDQEVKKRI